MNNLDDLIGFLVALAVLVGFATVYLAPSIIAIARSHPDAAAVVAVNVLFGCTFVGWGISLAWSLTAINQPPQFEPRPNRPRPQPRRPKPQQSDGYPPWMDE